MKKIKQYMIRPPMRNLDPTNRYKGKNVTPRELDQIFGGELCEPDTTLE